MNHRRKSQPRPGPGILLTSFVATAAIIGSFLVIIKGASFINFSPSVNNPLYGIKIFVNPDSPAAQAAESLDHSDPSATRVLQRIADQPVGIWFGSWNPISQVRSAVQTIMREAAAHHSVPLLVLYAFPHSGCTDAVMGASPGQDAYERWIGQIVAGIGKGKAIVILEPDALAQYIQLDCLSLTERRARLLMIRQAVNQIAKLPNAVDYIDAGNSRWQSVKIMASLLLAVDIHKVRGFSLNVSNFNSTAEEEAYGDKLSAMLHGAHYVIDISRNGTANANTWCNPPGQSLGSTPTTQTDNPLVDALLWVKPPWASDGTCNGGPPAGDFWLSYTLRLAKSAGW